MCVCIEISERTREPNRVQFEYWIHQRKLRNKNTETVKERIALKVRILKDEANNFQDIFIQTQNIENTMKAIRNF